MIINYPDHSLYIGDAIQENGNQLPHGTGTEFYVGGDVYSGNYFRGLRQGYGKYNWANGDSYTGHYYRNLRHGQGELYTAANQRRYNGGFVNNVEYGYAVVSRVDNAANGGAKHYVGYMKNGQQHGPGKLTFTASDGLVTTFEGNWENGRLHGAGRQTHPHECLSGIFVNGVLQGPGTRMDPRTGITQNVTFQNGIPI